MNSDKKRIAELEAKVIALELMQSEFISRRQIVAIPPIKPEFTEHQIYKKYALVVFAMYQSFQQK